MSTDGAGDGDDLGRYGALLDEAEFAASPQAIPPQWLQCDAWPTQLPSGNTLSGTPSVSMQGTPGHLGSPGSCEAQSFGYGLGTYTVNQAGLGDPTNPQDQVSAAWLYVWALNSQGHACPKGSLSTPYLKQLIGYGCPSVAEVAYEPSCSYLNPSQINLDLGDYSGVTQFCLGSFAALHISQDTLDLLKAFLAAGQAIAFSGLVLTGYSNPPLTPNSQTGLPGIITETSTIAGSGHGQLLIGYDDDMNTASTQGAFLVQNSFGTAWPPSAPSPDGTVWMSYSSFLAAQKLAAVAYPIALPDPITPLGIALTPSGSPAPAATLQWVSHWAPGSTGVSIVLLLQFASPVTVQSVSIRQQSGGDTATGSYNNPITCGYLYFCRTDGNQFEGGVYDLTIEATFASGKATYSGQFTLIGASPNSPAAGPISAAASILDTIGQPAGIS